MYSSQKQISFFAKVGILTPKLYYIILVFCFCLVLCRYVCKYDIQGVLKLSLQFQIFNNVLFVKKREILRAVLS